MSEEKIKLAEEIIKKDEAQQDKKKSWDIKSYIDKKLNQAHEETVGLMKAEHNHKEKHTHATHSSDNFCPECGDKNPDFDDRQLTCEACDKPVGTKKQIEAGQVKYCRNCGHDKAVERVEE